MTGVNLGADLWCFSPDDDGNPVPPVLITDDGAGNPWNFGFRTMVATDYGLFLGTSNASNLLTEDTYPPVDPLNRGGWEVIRIDTVKEELELVGMDVQRGADQRSYVRYIDLLFDRDLELSDLDRVRLTRYRLDGSGGTAVALNGVLSFDGNRLEFDFGREGIGGNASSSVGDGYYEIRLDLDGNGTFETTRHFYRLLGDVNGDRRVDRYDLNVIRSAYGQRGDGLAADLSGNGVVNYVDWWMAYYRCGRRLASYLVLDD
jgi:hypothetical protein